MNPTAHEPGPKVYEMIGLALLGSREAIRGCRDANRALEQLLFRLELEHPGADAEWEPRGIPASTLPAVAAFATREIRPWIRQIDRSVSRTDDWARRLREVLVALVHADAGARDWAGSALRESIERARPGEAESWRSALAERRPPKGAPVRLLAAIGLLEEAFDCVISFSPANPWQIEGGKDP